MRKETHRKTVKTRAILPMARILFRITSLRAATDPPGKRKKGIEINKVFCIKKYSEDANTLNLRGNSSYPTGVLTT